MTDCLWEIVFDFLFLKDISSEENSIIKEEKKRFLTLQEIDDSRGTFSKPSWSFDNFFWKIFFSQN